MKKEIAVIILNWNGRKLLKEFLLSVSAYTPETLADVIVADNGSTDDSVDFIINNYPEVKLLRFSENLGFAEGYNRAIASVAADYTYTILLNSDVAVKDDWVTPLYDFISSHPKAVAVQPKIMSYSEPEKFEYAGAAGGFIDCNGYPYCRGRIFSTVETDKGQYNEPIRIFWASGAALMVRNDAYLRAGGLDKDFFAHMEEIDLCWRLQLNGGQIWCVPASKVYHLGGGSLPAGNPRKTYLNFRNNLLMLYKNLPDSVRTGRLLKRRLLDTVAFLKFAATLDFDNARAIWRAHRDFARMRKQYTAHPQVDLMTDDVDILTEYYLHGHTTYSSLGK
ncbi:MAG: glycosyltransferase family 2 protein [Lachnoclostridium sp.]|nr:glycosyltransferase family 2 protein [Lachnoclostridium sp.]